MKKYNLTLYSLLSTLVALGMGLLNLHADSLVIEGDLDVQAAGSANGDVKVDNELTVSEDTSVSPDVKASFKVEDNGVIWAGQASEFNVVEQYPYGDGSYLVWLPQRGSLLVGKPDFSFWESSPLESVGQHSISFGNFSLATDNYSIAGGSNTYAAGENSAAFGEYTTAGGNSSFAVGAGGNASGDYSSVIGGMEAKAEGYYSVAWGYGAQAKGDTSTSFGEAAIAYGHASMAWGLLTTANSQASTTFGAFNLGIGTEADSDFGWYDLDSLLEIGNGTSSGNLSNAVTVLKNGQSTLENKYWDALNPNVVPSDPDSYYAGDQSSAGEALVVNGHARFSGNATINGDLILNSSSIAGGDVTNWNQAYLWGNHATQGYIEEGANDSVSWGANASATGENATAWGQATASQFNATAWGDATASGFTATAWGTASAWGDYATAAGLSFAYGDFSTAFGYETFAFAENSMSTGTFNLGHSSSLLEVGNGVWVDGEPAPVQSNALTVLYDGRVVLGSHGSFDALQTNEETLQVRGAILVSDYANPPLSPTPGAIRYDSVNDTFEGYVSDNGTGNPGWVSLSSSGASSGPTTALVSADDTALTAISSTGTDTPHTVIDGTVALAEAQGDIPMGIYGNNP